MTASDDRVRATPAMWGMLIPFVVGLALFGLVPAVRTVFLSFGPRHDVFAFYRLAVFDPLVWLALANTFGFALIYSILQTALALAAALLIAASSPLAARVLAFVLFSAHVIGVTFAGILFQGWLGTRQGGVNGLISWLGVESPVDFLTSPSLAMPVLIAVAPTAAQGLAFFGCRPRCRRRIKAYSTQPWSTVPADGVGCATRPSRSFGRRCRCCSSPASSSA